MTSATLLGDEPFVDREPQSAAAPAVATARVLHVVNGEHFAGAERVQDLLALCLPEFGYDVGFACIKPNKFPQMRRSQSTPLYELPMRGKFDLRPARALAKLIRREGYSIVHTHTPRTALVGRVASAWAGVPMVHHLHSPTSADTTHQWSNRLNVVTERCSLLGIRGLITVSHSLGGYARNKGYASELVTVVPNGVPTPGPLANRGAPTGTWTVGTVALFRPRKGLEVLLDALAELIGAGADIRLRAVGTFETPDYEREIKAQAERLGIAQHIDWRGFQRDVNAELAAMDLFVLPSLFGEGLPMVILEAMAAGVPVIGTRVEGVPEAVRDGVDGLIAEAGNASSLAEMMARFVTQEVNWSALRANAYLRQATQFSDRSMARGVSQVYDRILN